MFAGCTKLTDISTFKLPATELAGNCYRFMFGNCTSLTKAPELPATELACGCYARMFTACSSLIEAPKLHAKRLCDESYMNMFSYCNKLEEITMLATDVSADDCLYLWVESISKTGTFTKAKGVNIQEGHSGIPIGWDVKEI
jgi:hypothetical protein